MMNEILPAGAPTFFLASFLFDKNDDNSSKADGPSICGDQFWDLFHNSEDDITAYENAANHLSPDDPRLGRFWHNIGLWYLKRYTRFRRSDDLQRAMETIKKLIKVQSPDEHLPPWLVNLGNLYYCRFAQTGDLNDISEAINNQLHALQLTPDGDTSLLLQRENLALSFERRFDRTGDLDDISQAINNHQQALQLSPVEHPDLRGWLSRLGLSFLRRYQRTEDISDISEAIEIYQHAVRLTTDEHPNLPDLLNILGEILSRRFDRTGNLGDLSEAIKHYQHALQLTPDGHPDLPVRLTNLGLSFAHHFQHTEDMDDVSEAIRNLQHALRITPDGHASLPDLLSNLGSSYLSRFNRTGDLDDINEAVKIHQRALKLTPDGYVGLTAQLNNLGSSLQHRFDRTGDMDDINEAIKLHQRALRLTPDGHTSLPIQLNNLGISFSHRYDRTGDPNDISEAIKNQQRALQLTPNGNPTFLVQPLSNLGLSFLSRFENTGDLRDVTEAIKNQQRAVQCTPDGHAGLPALLTGLGSSLVSRFNRTGDLDDIFEAIKHGQRAVQLTPDGHANLPFRLHNLAGSFSSRFERTGDIDDISEAIQHHRHALQLTPDGHPNSIHLLNNLGLSLSRRFDHTGDMDDISEAIKTHQHALRLIPDGDARLPVHLINLGKSFLHRFNRTGNLDDLSEGIKSQQRALKLTPGGHASLPIQVNNLGSSFLSRFNHTGDLNDISEAMKHYQSALELTPDGHADLPFRHSNVGQSFLRRFESTGDMDNLERAVSSFRRSATSATGSPSVRLLAAKQWALLSQKSPFLSQLLDAHACIIQLLTLISGLENTVQRRHETLINSSQLSIAASAAALSLGHVDKALEWLVEGRCIIWNQINQLRTPVNELRAHDRALSDRFSAISRELEIAGTRSQSHTASSETALSMDYKISLEEQAGRHIKLAKEWDQLLITIRNIPGFGDFLQPKKCDDIMRGLPDEGVIVIINIHHDRCDALALMAGADEPMHIPLTEFSYQKAEDLAQGLRSHLLRHNAISRIGIPLDDHSLPDIDLAEVLSILWSQVVWPILESLAFSLPESSAKLPRIWWCPTGPLVFLPIHVAGIYDGREIKGIPNQCLSDFAVSSYIPTVNALLRSPKLNPAEKSHDEVPTGLLIVSQPNTPERSQILGAADEAKKVARQLEKRGISSFTLVDQYGTVESVSTAMQSFSCVHMACHALQNTTSPLKSSIYLHDGPLELSEIMKKNLPNSDFAFLSACQTSTGDKNLPEEVVHLVAGMLAAGYRSVVGTMWSIADTHGPDIAESFYESLLDDAMTDGPRIDGGGAARALHFATRRFREKTPDSLLVWVPYIHIGI